MMSTNSFPFRRRSLVLALMLATGAAPAAIINVSGNCTLPAAINNANTDTDTDGAGFGCKAGSGADTLNLSTNTTYTLTNVAEGEDGLPWVSSTITIYGHGSTIARSGVSGTPDFRILHVTATGNLTLNKLTLTGGRLQDGNGGGISNNGKLALNNSTVSGNGYAGGGIYNRGNMVINNSTISRNRAMTYGRDSAGGITNKGSMTLSKSTVSNNSCDYDRMVSCPGGIYNSGTMTLKNSTVSGNHGGFSSGIDNSGRVTLINCTVSLNSSTYGSIIANYGNMRLTSSTISHNHGIEAYVGEILTESVIGNSGVITISNSTISQNDHLKAGGILNDISGTAVLTNSIISNNTAYDNGGGIDNYGNMIIINATFSGNSSGQSGGGIFNRGDISLSHVTVSGNKSAPGNGGGIKNDNLGVMTLSNSLIANDTRGGDCNNEGILTLQGNNLIEDGSCGATLSGDPKLAPLLDNGGLTPTHALLVGSPAINAADKSLCVATDQRKVKRPSLAGAGNCDIGAFERMAWIPSSVEAIVKFFDDQTANGGIIGKADSKYIAKNKLEALRNQLLVAGHYKNRNKTTDACAQLVRTFKQIDPDNTPDGNDYVTGSAAGQLADQLTALHTDWLCNTPPDPSHLSAGDVR